jgi:hypothetical protein
MKKLSLRKAKKKRTRAKKKTMDDFPQDLEAI